MVSTRPSRAVRTGRKASSISDKQAVGIRDVARAAGVSRQTVSRVLNGHPSLRPETRERVQQVIHELNYRPNLIARALGTASTRALGVVVSERSQYGPATAVQGVESAAREAGYVVHLTTLNDSSPASVHAALQLQADNRVEGIVIIAPQTAILDAIDELALDLPYVLLYSRADEDPHELFVDQRAGAQAATRHLLRLGHRSICHLSGPQEWIEAEARMQGFLEELSAWDVAPSPPVLGDWTADFGYHAGRQLLLRGDFTAIFASNDLMALGVMHAAHDAGLTVPGDLSVVGFDDIPEAAHFWPPLTTVRQDFAELGRRCVERLLAPEAAQHPTMLEPALIVRASTAAPGR